MFVVEPANTVVGLTDAEPEPSALLFTVTVCVPVTVVSEPPEVDFSCTVNVPAPAFPADGAAAAPPAFPLVSPYTITTVCPELNAEGNVTVINCPATVTLLVEAPPPLMFAVVYPALLLLVFCGAVQFAGTDIVITAPEANPPVVAV